MNYQQARIHTVKKYYHQREDIRKRLKSWVYQLSVICYQEREKML